MIYGTDRRLRQGGKKEAGADALPKDLRVLHTQDIRHQATQDGNANRARMK